MFVLDDILGGGLELEIDLGFAVGPLPQHPVGADRRVNAAVILGPLADGEATRRRDGVDIRLADLFLLLVWRLLRSNTTSLTEPRTEFTVGRAGSAALHLPHQRPLRRRQQGPQLLRLGKDRRVGPKRPHRLGVATDLQEL